MPFIENFKTRAYWAAAGIAALLVGAQPADAGFVTQTNLISDGVVPAAVIDPNFFNPWGMAAFPGGPIWVNLNNFGTSIIVLANGTEEFPEFNVPLPTFEAGTPGILSAPDGIVANTTNGFKITQNGVTAPALFLFDTEDGTISGWNPEVNPTDAVLAIDKSVNGTGAVYKGLGIFTDSAGTFLLAANFRSGFVEVYDGNFHLVRQFRDNRLPADWGPFNVQTLSNGQIYVTYAKQDQSKHDDTGGFGFGAVDRVDIFGNVLAHVPGPFVFNSPWGLSIAPSSWGHFANQLLVGNFEDGTVRVFDAMRLNEIGTLHNANGSVFTVDGLWGLMQGNGTGPADGGDTDKIYFSAGPNGQADGIWGYLSYTPVNGQ